MKALSIRQPWASAIINGGKDIENRSWKTKYRGRFLIHASLKSDKNAPKELWDYVPTDTPIMGGIIGSVELVDVVESSDSKWFQGPRGFVLKNPEPIDFIPCHGNLNFFTPKIKGLEDL